MLAIEIEGNQVYTSEEIRGGLYTKIGELLDPKVLQQDLIYLWQNKRVRAEVFEETVAGGIRLRFKVQEVPAIRELSIRGNREIKKEDLLDAAKLTPGIPIDEVVAVRARTDLLRFYRDRGYFFADVLLKYDRAANRVIFEILEGPLVKVESVEFEGNHSIPATYFLGLKRSLNSVMKLGSGFLFFGGSEFKEGTLREDLIELRSLYRNAGFRDAVVEVKELEFSEDRKEVTIRILVQEGPRYIVSSVSIEGNESFPQEDLLPLIRLKSGDFYTADAVQMDRRSLARFYGERGYPEHPSISDHWRFEDPPKEKFSDKDARVALVYQIHEGKKIKIRDIQIQGNRATQDRVIRRMLTFFPGEYANTAELARSISRLNSTNYFRDERGYPGIRYSFADTGDPAQKDMILQVSEGETGRFIIGGGVSSVEGLFANLLLQKNNFDLFKTPSSLGNTFQEIFDGTAFTGAGQELTLSLSPGTRISNYNLRFREPDLFGDHLQTTSFDFNLFRRLRFYQEVDEERTGLNLVFGKNWTEKWATFLNLRNELIDYSDVAPDASQFLQALEGANSLRSMGVDLVHSDLDVPLDPTSGYSMQLSTELGGSFLGADFDYYKTSLSGRYFFPVGRDERGRPYTLLMRGSFGYSNSFADSPNVPFPVRYFTGGPETIRGFTYRGVGPMETGHPSGGEVLALAGAELRFPIYSTPFADGLAEAEWVRGVLFVDSGTLALDVHDDALNEWRLSAGAGVRIKFPFLPQLAIALDYGVPFLSKEEDSRRSFSFSIMGASF